MKFHEVKLIEKEEFEGERKIFQKYFFIFCESENFPLTKFENLSRNGNLVWKYFKIYFFVIFWDDQEWKMASKKLFFVCFLKKKIKIFYS